MDIITSTLVFALLTSNYITIYSHEVTDVAGLTSFSFGIEEQDRYVMCWKKVCFPKYSACFVNKH
jgi:hypothetical protein